MIMGLPYLNIPLSDGIQLPSNEKLKSLLSLATKDGVWRQQYLSLLLVQLILITNSLGFLQGESQLTIALRSLCSTSDETIKLKDEGTKWHCGRMTQ